MPRLGPVEEERRLQIILDCKGHWSKAARRIGVNPSSLSDFLAARGLRSLDDIRTRIASTTQEKPT